MITSPPTKHHRFSILKTQSARELKIDFPSVDDLESLDQNHHPNLPKTTTTTTRTQKLHLKVSNLLSPVQGNPVLHRKSKNTNKSVQWHNQSTSMTDFASQSSSTLIPSTPTKMRSIQMNQELAAFEKKKLELSQRKLFDKHLKYIQNKSQHSIDSIRSEIFPISPQQATQQQPQQQQPQTKSASYLPTLNQQLSPHIRVAKSRISQAVFTSMPTTKKPLLPLPPSPSTLPTINMNFIEDPKIELPTKKQLQQNMNRKSLLPHPKFLDEDPLQINEELPLQKESGESQQQLQEKSEQQEKQFQSHYMLIDQVEQNSLATNFLDKFRFFKSVPIGGLIAVTRTQPIYQSDSTLSSPQQQQQASPLIETTAIPKIPKMPIQQQITSSSRYNSILKKQMNISKQQREIAEKKLCAMTPRLATFFSTESKANLDIWDRFLTACRTFSRLLDVMFSLEKNNNKNVTYLKRLLFSKPYILNEILEEQFSQILHNVISNLENVLVNENVLSKYFRAETSLLSILTDTYLKDIPYLNGQLQIHLNAQQLITAAKMAEIIQEEFQMVKQKEKSLIFDQIDGTGAITNLHLKKSYNFFNDYLYNIKPHRNTYDEIIQFEKNYGPFSQVNNIDRNIYQNLDKSYNHIRSKNKS